VLGSIAGRHPRDLDPVKGLVPEGSAILIDVCWYGLWILVSFVAFCFFCGVICGVIGSTNVHIRQRLANGLKGIILGVFLVAVCLGGPVLVCAALAALSLWAGMGAGPQFGALYGAMSVAVAIGLGARCFRPFGRLIVKKKQEAMADVEEIT
jgi:hypothetical protein